MCGPKGQRTVNVLLYLGSQVTLISEQLASDLGLKGPADNISLGTVNGSRSYRSQRVEFDLRPRASSQQFCVRGARTTPVLNVKGPAVNWPAVKRQWPNLCDLKLPNTNSSPVAVPGLVKSAETRR